MKAQYNISELEELISAIFIAAGCSKHDAKIVSDVLMAAELRGIPSHGLIRIKDYIGLWKKNRLTTQPQIEIVHQTPSTALVDGGNGLGMLAGKIAMEIAIEKATQCGTGWVAVRNSNHFGIAGYYSLMAAKNDMIGIAMTNANALVAPTFSIDRMLGTNPIAFAIPGKTEPAFVADFATTPIARGKLELMEKQGKQASSGFVQDERGLPSTDPSILRRGGAILPLGGDYEHASHKGYCLGAMVDILSAVLPGANFGPFVPPQVAYLEPKKDYPGLGLGHFFGAMRLDAFRPADEIKEYLDQWIHTFRSAKPGEGHDKVLIPGDPERENEIRIKNEGLQIMPEVWAELKNTANDLGIDTSKWE